MNNVRSDMKIMKQIWLYRALMHNECSLDCVPFTGNIISEAYSRVVESSIVKKEITFRCFSEDPRIALKYSMKEGYSGEIAKVQVNIYEDGTCGLVESPDAFVQRLWMMKDWISLMENANTQIRNLNSSNNIIKFINVISYTRNSARGYAYASKIWVIHNEGKPIKYTYILTGDEKEEITNVKRFYCKSYKAINYQKNTKYVAICDRAIAELKKLKEYAEKTWYVETMKSLEKIKSQHMLLNCVSTSGPRDQKCPTHGL